MAEAKPAAKAATTEPAVTADTPESLVGQVLTPELLAQLRAATAAQLSAQKVDPTFSDPNEAVSLDVGLHPMLLASVRQDLKDEPVPAGAVAMYAATDVRVSSETGHVFLFPANTVQFVPEVFVALCKKHGCAVYEPKK